MSIYSIKTEATVKPEGTSLSAKIIFAMALVVAISCSIFIITAVFLIGENIEEEVNKKGLSIAKLLASIDLSVAQYLENPDIPNAKLTNLKIKLNEKLKELDESQYAQKQVIQSVIKNIDGEIGGQVKDGKNTNPLCKFIKSEEGNILSLFIDKGGCRVRGNESYNTILYCASPNPNYTPNPKIRDPQGNYEIGDTYVTSKGIQIPAKYIIYCIIEHENPIGQVRVVMDTTQFATAKIRIVRILLIPLLIALGTSILIGGFMSTKIVTPIKELISDIDEISKGNLNHRATIKSSDEIGMIGVRFNRMTKSLKLYMEEVVSRAVIAQEYESATNLINEYLLKIKERPKIPNLDISIIYYPSKDVSGDYYDYDIIDKSKLYIIVSDVSGKGLPASLISTVFKNLVMNELERINDPKEILINVNKTLRKSLKKGMFVTTSFLVYDIEKLTLTAYSAGHLPVLIYKPSEGKVIEVNPPGIAIGLDQRLFEKKLEKVELQLKKSDRFISYSDGIIEAQDENNKCFGIEKLKEILVKYPNKTSTEFIQYMSKEINGFTNGAIIDNRLFDDITMVTGKVI